MSPTELYDDVALDFPAVWPKNPAHVWESLYSRQSTSFELISNLLSRYIYATEVIVLVHSSPGIGAIMLRDAAPSLIVDHFLKADIQVSDKQYAGFVEISRIGVGTGWRANSKHA